MRGTYIIRGQLQKKIDIYVNHGIVMSDRLTFSWFVTHVTSAIRQGVPSIGDRWALSPLSVISDIGLSLISELPISD
jgi:hypothetical protein